MSRVYMIRHGQTLFNVLRRKQGWCDSPLTEVGIGQARAAGAYLRERGITFDHVYSSTSERCCDTTELVVPGQPYERVKGLKEWYFGKFEGVSEDLGLRTFSCTSYTGRRRDARYSSGVIHPSPCEILPERNHRIQESRAPMNSPRAAPLQSRA